MYTNIPKLFGFVVYPFMDLLGNNVACARFGTKIQLSSDFHYQWTEMLKRYLYFYIVILKCY